MNDWHYWHRQLWGWLAGNPWSDKDDWPNWKLFSKGVLNNCFACHAATVHHPDEDTCYHSCPLDWESPYTLRLDPRVPCWESYYGDWYYRTKNYVEGASSRDDAEAADIVQLARKIRDTPVRPGIVVMGDLAHLLEDDGWTTRH